MLTKCGLPSWEEEAGQRHSRSKIALTNVRSINWYMRRQRQIDEFIRLSKNPSYLTGVKFDTDRIKFTNDINKW